MQAKKEKKGPDGLGFAVKKEKKEDLGTPAKKTEEEGTSVRRARASLRRSQRWQRTYVIFQSMNSTVDSRRSTGTESSYLLSHQQV